MHTCPYFLAWRYIRSARYHRPTRILMLFCLLGISLSSCALIMVCAITQGFEYATEQQLRQFHPDLVIDSWGNNLQVDRIKEVIGQEFPDIRSANPTHMQYALLYNQEQMIYDVMWLKGVESTSLPEALITHMQQPTPATASSVMEILEVPFQVIIGSLVAQHHKLNLGDSFTLLFIADPASINEEPTIQKTVLRVGGICKFGIEEYDNALIFCSRTCMQKLFPHAPLDSIEIMLAPHTDIASTVAAVQKRFGLHVYSWKDLYPSLFAALRLEKYAGITFMLLMSFITSVTVISLLYLYIHQKRTDIALLYAMGASLSTIRKIFMSIGLSIATTAHLLGMIIALALIGILQVFPISLPDSYVVTQIPVVISFVQLFFLSTFIIGMSAGASYWATRSIAPATIASILKGVV